MNPDFGIGGLQYVPEKLIDFFNQGLLQLFDSVLLLVDHVIPRDRETLSFDAISQTGLPPTLQLRIGCARF